MIPDIGCMASRLACKMAKHDLRYKPLWICKGYASKAVVNDVQYVFLGYCKVETVRTGLVGLELGSNSSDIGRAVTVSSNDYEIEVFKNNRSEGFFKQNILYYFTQEIFTPVSSTSFLNEHGRAGNKQFKCLEVIDRALTYYRLILREEQTRKLKNGEKIQGQTID